MSALNRVSFNKKVKNNTPEIILCILVTILLLFLAFRVNIFLSLSVAVVGSFACWRLFCGKLKVKEGDVILFCGLPGSGKTSLQNYVADYNKRKYEAVIVGNEEFSATSKVCDMVLPRIAFGWFKAPPKSIICTDEASLNGWDNRDWAKNFSPKSLAYWKKIRHYHNAAILTNQGFDELDKKIRDGLVSHLYYVENHGRYLKAVRLDKTFITSEISGLPQESYVRPSIWQRLLDPSCVLYCKYSKSGDLFNSWNPDPLPDLADIGDYHYVEPKKGAPYWEKNYTSPAGDDATSLE